MVYYAGHGLIDPQDGALILALPDCEPDVPHEAGLPYEWVRRAVAASTARRRVVILDCCYAGRASPEMATATTGTDAVADRAEIDETCLLVSAPRNRTAAAPVGQRHTAFTGELIRVFTDGLIDGAATLSVEEVWREIRRALMARGYERPEIRERNSGGSIAIARNAAVRLRNLTGSILVAARSFTDEDLRQSVVLVLRHDATGAVGVRITTPDGPLPDDFPLAWRRLLHDPAVLFDGGPVARDGYIVVTMLRPGTVPPLRFTPVRDRLGTVALSSLPQSLEPAVDGMRVFSGYLGWGPGELEAYLDAGMLVTTSHSTRHVFSGRPRDLWHILQGVR